jgi:ABC-type protease/lipase transport system fused ATPase/permease subunit
MAPELWAAFGVVLSALIGHISARHTARTSARAADRTAAAEELSAAAASRQVDVLEWQAILAELRRQMDAQSTEITRLSDPVTALEGRYLAAIRYARQVLRWARGLLPEAVPPSPPDVISEEF